MLKRLSPAEVWDTLLATYWFLPLLLTAGAVALCGALVYLDHRAPQQVTGVQAFFFPTSVEGSQALLSAIVSSMMTVVAVTFSITVVALTVASQHYGPRLLNSFMRDRTVQIVLGLLTGTFAYTVLVLGSVETGGGEPLRWAVSGAMVLVAVSLMALIVFVHHVTKALQVSTIVLSIVSDFDAALPRELPEQRDGAASSQLEMPHLTGHGNAADDQATLRSDEDGYVQRVDEEAVVRLAAEAGALIRVVRPPGRFVVRGAALATVQPASAATPALARAFNELCVLGADRTVRHDIEFAIKQLVEVALRALSPGVNEPFTAIACVDRLGQCLSQVAARGVRPRMVHDGTGTVRLVMPRQTFATLLRAAFDPIRIFAGPNPAIHARLLDMVAMLAEITSDEAARAALRQQADLIAAAARHDIRTAEDQAFVEERFRRALAAVQDGSAVR